MRDGLDDLLFELEEIEQKKKKALLKIGRMLFAKAVQNVPVTNGYLKNEIAYTLEGPNFVCVGTNNPYCPYVEFGTGIFAANGDGRKDGWAYMVEGKYAEKYWSETKDNCFMDEAGNKWIWTRGQRPNPFLGDALDELQPEIEKVIEGMFDA